MARHPRGPRDATLTMCGIAGFLHRDGSPGAPVRLKVPRQLGYKSVKFLSKLTVTDSLQQFGKGLGSSSPEGGYSWYAGI